MRSREIEERLKEAVTHSVPDVLDGILSGCEKKGRVMPMRTENNKPKRWIAAACAAAAMLVLMVGGLYGWSQYSLHHRVDSIIGLDVNPGIELKVSEAEKVLEASAVNADALCILDGMELAGTSLDVAVNAILGSMLKNGYIGDLSNSILVTVESRDAARGEQLQQRLVSEIGGILSSHSVEGAILSQTLQEDAELRQLAETHGISQGKASLIQSILLQDSLHTAEELAGMTINELNLLATSSDASLSGIEATGAPSDKAYIGEAQAARIALTHAGVAHDAASKLRTKLDWDDGRAEYEVEFDTSDTRYDYEIDAITGEILEYDRKAKHTVAPSAPGETAPTASPAPTATAGNYIGESRAKAIALDHAGLSEGAVTFRKLKLEEENGRMQYDMEFYSDDFAYEYEIDAVTGAILDLDLDAIEDGDAPKATSTPRATPSSTAQATPAPTAARQDIGRDRAQGIALGHAGVSASQVSGLKVKRDEEDGRQVYEVEFDVGSMEYQYEIDAATGEILDWDQDTDD